MLDELRRLIILKLDDNVITDLGLGWELEQVPHEVGNLTLVQETTSIDIDDTEGVSDLFSVEVFLALLLDSVLMLRQHLLWSVFKF